MNENDMLKPEEELINDTQAGGAAEAPADGGDLPGAGEEPFFISESRQAEEDVSRIRNEKSHASASKKRARQKQRRGSVKRDFYGAEPKRKRRGGRLVIAFIAVILASFIAGAVFMHYVGTPLLMRYEINKMFGADTADKPQASPSASQPASPAPTPQSRPGELPEFGGELPAITDMNNPIPDIVEQLQYGVVNITAQNSALNDEEDEVIVDIGGGTGFFVTADGYIVTNSHVIADGNRYKVTDRDGNEYDALFVGNDTEADIAVLKVDADVKFRALPLGSSEKTRVGELVVAFGNPIGAGENLDGTITVGYVSAVNRKLTFNGVVQSFIQTDAALNMGNSGGPLINSDGQIIGMTTLKSVSTNATSDGSTVNTEGLGFAIPIDLITEKISYIILNGSVTKPGIGLYYYDMKPEELEAYGLEAGCLVDSVFEGGASVKAGIKPGDIITECDGVSVSELDGSLADYVSKLDFGDVLHFTIYREGETLSIDVTVGDINSMR